MALAAIAAAAESETEARSPSGNMDFARSRVPPLPGVRGSAKRPCAPTDTAPEWRHDYALTYLVASVASWVVPLNCVDARQAYPINHGSRRVMSPHSTDARVVLLDRPASAAGLEGCLKS